MLHICAIECVNETRICLTILNLNCILIFQEENKEIALGTSKLNYLDPRISVAW